ncbi:MAG: sensor histidine kinase [Parasphingopyxis sp.]|uniref:sensor histidine kinase n=1 Tax=Parasphingopyxis sp. TaxID=1920299 RepID=UPI003FA02574
MIEDFAQEIVDTIGDALLVIKDDLTVEFANQRFYHLFDVDADRTIGLKLYELGNGQWDIPKLRVLLEDIIPSQTMVSGYLVEHDFPYIGRRVMRLGGRKTVIKGNGSRRILLTISDITEAHDLERQLERERLLTRGIVDTVREPLLVLDGDLRILEASRAFYRMFEVSPPETLGERLPDLGNGQWNNAELVDLLERIVPNHETVENFVIEHEFPIIGRRIMCLNARKMYREGNNTKTLLLAIEDVTERKQLETEREEALRQSAVLMEELNHRVKNNLAMISAMMEIESRALEGADASAAFDRIRARLDAVGSLYRALTQQRAVDSVNAADYVAGLARKVVESVGNGCEVACDIDAMELSTQTAIPLGLIVNELMTNAVKYAFDESANDARVSVALKSEDECVRLRVCDNGRGFDGRSVGDTGMGNRLIEGLARQLGAEIERDSGEGGTEVSMSFTKLAA